MDLLHYPSGPAIFGKLKKNHAGIHPDTYRKNVLEENDKDKPRRHQYHKKFVFCKWVKEPKKKAIFPLKSQTTGP